MILVNGNYPDQELKKFDGNISDDGQTLKCEGKFTWKVTLWKKKKTVTLYEKNIKKRRNKSESAEKLLRLIYSRCLDNSSSVRLSCSSRSSFCKRQ